MLTPTPRELDALRNGATVLCRPIEPQPHPITEAMRDIPTENRWWAATVTRDEWGVTYRNPGSDYQHDWACPFGATGDTLTLGDAEYRVVRVWCQRVQDATHETLISLGGLPYMQDAAEPIYKFPDVWNSENPSHPWAENPWAWFVELERTEQ